MRRILFAALPFALVAMAQDDKPAAASAEKVTTPEKVNTPEKIYTVETGTKVPLSLLNSVSTKNSAEGDRIYLETIFPILANGRIVIPPGSHVTGTVTSVKRAGRVKGRAELFVRFDSLILPNGVVRDFRSRIGTLDGRATEELDRKEGKIKGEGNKSGDLVNVGIAASTGTGIGALGGAAAGRPGMGAAIGAGAGAAAALVGVLVTRGPDATLAKGTTLDMVLDRPLTFDEAEVDFMGARSFRAGGDGGGPLPSRRGSVVPGGQMPGRVGFPRVP